MKYKIIYILKTMISHDKKLNNLFKNWLMINILLIIVMIVVGGLTRLTDSGLSITEWELFKGILPPLDDTSWEFYFNEYKKIPQYTLLNSSMTLSEFKVIFYWEYAHRVLGRIIGLFFLIPLIYFHFIKKIHFKKLLSCYIALFLIIVQGVIGWYMVMSGLVNDVTVSHYRLSLHLTTAIIILSIIFWQFLNVKKDKFKKFFNLDKFKIPYLVLIFLILVQIIFGAFVSGLDAGKIYQTWPLMGYNYFPNDLTITSFINFFNFDNHSLVQFYHRNIAYIITIYILVLSYFIIKNQNRNLFKPISFLFLFLFLQIGLGIFTLLSDLNIALASAHQIISVFLILSALNLYHSLIK